MSDQPSFKGLMRDALLSHLTIAAIAVVVLGGLVLVAALDPSARTAPTARSTRR